MVQTVKDEFGRIHNFPDEATPDQITQAMKQLPSPGLRGSAEIFGTGLRQGIESLIGIPHEMARGSAEYRAPEYPAPEDPIGRLLDEQRRARALEREQSVRAAGQAGMERFPSSEDVSGFITEQTGLTPVQPQQPSGRILRAVGQGIGSGAVFGPAGTLGGAVGAGAAQGAAEAGAPEWAQTAIGIAAPILGGRFGTPKPKPTTRAALRAQADAAYDASRAAGLSVADTAIGRMASDIAAEAKRAGIDPTLHPKATAALGRIEKATGQQMSLEEIDTLRQIVGDARGSVDAGERRIGQIMAEKLDDFLDGLQPSDIAGGDKVAVAKINEARERWNRMRRTETIEDALKTAQHRASVSGSGGNINNAMRQEIRKILDNKKAVRPFSKDERALMERVVQGAPVENLLRLAGKLSPEGNGLMMALGLGATAANPMFALAAGGGMVSKRLADAATRRNVERLRDLVASGQVPQGSLTPTHRQLLDALRRSAGGAAAQTQ